MSEFKRTLETWKSCDPKAMSAMSPAAIFYGFSDAKADIVKLHRELAALREELAEIKESLSYRGSLLGRYERRAKAAEQRNEALEKLIAEAHAWVDQNNFGGSDAYDLRDRLAALNTESGASE